MNIRATSELLGLCAHRDIMVGTINAGPTTPPPRRKWMGLTWRECSSPGGRSAFTMGEVWPTKDREENTDLKAKQLTGQKHSLLPCSVRSRKCTPKMYGFASWQHLSQNTVILSQDVSTFSSNHTLMFFYGSQSLPDLELSVGPANTQRCHLKAEQRKSLQRLLFSCWE
uniref:Uncharacterized protein n=1 Tax=Pipistrellus kuhlii TaxID=59472 RepID=A0A7J8B299_PIPKU|nr:hypothetical protein mPipKuh1_007785 [Pipistrellus kuhlii]